MQMERIRMRSSRSSSSERWPQDGRGDGGEEMEEEKEENWRFWTCYHFCLFFVCCSLFLLVAERFLHGKVLRSCTCVAGEVAPLL